VCVCARACDCGYLCVCVCVCLCVCAGKPPGYRPARISGIASAAAAPSGPASPSVKPPSGRRQQAAPTVSAPTTRQGRQRSSQVAVAVRPGGRSPVRRLGVFTCVSVRDCAWLFSCVFFVCASLRVCDHVRGCVSVAVSLTVVLARAAICLAPRHAILRSLRLLFTNPRRCTASTAAESCVVSSAGHGPQLIVVVVCRVPGMAVDSYRCACVSIRSRRHLLRWPRARMHSRRRRPARRPRTCESRASSSRLDQQRRQHRRPWVSGLCLTLLPT
jgi:hypothetical protein